LGRSWLVDLTYLWCGNRDRWSYFFNVIDVFHREWLGYAFETSAVKEHAIMSVNNAFASHPDAVPEKLTLRCDNEPPIRLVRLQGFDGHLKPEAGVHPLPHA
jgi:hypothetical protein